MSKVLKGWAYEKDEENETLTILVQDVDRGWLSIATLNECPTKDMSDEEIDNVYNDLMTSVIDNYGYKFTWEVEECN